VAHEKHEGGLIMSDAALDVILLAIALGVAGSSITIYFVHRRALKDILKDLRQPGSWRKEWSAREKTKKNQVDEI
jgi:hypothetical protein